MAEQRPSAATTPLWIITTLGALITALGVYIQATGSFALQQVIAGTLAAVGGAVIGAAISLYFSAGEGRNTLLAVKELLAGSLRANMTSTEDDLRAIRRTWHYYYLTEWDDRFQWRHIEFPFDRSNTTGSIVLSYTEMVRDREARFRTEVAMRGDRMIMVDQWEDSGEPPIVAVTPAFTEEFRAVRAGIAFLRSWEGNDLVTKCLWSPSPLVDAAGPEVPAAAARRLEKMWSRHFGARHEILPSAHDETTHGASTD